MTIGQFRVRLYVSRGGLDHSLLAQLSFGRGRWIGAGYIGGFTAYAGYRTVAQGNMYVPKRFRAGVTRNANNLPWTRH